MDDLFSQRPKDDDIEAKRRHARMCFHRFVGRWPMSPEERAALRARKASGSLGDHAKGYAMEIETRTLERNPEFLDSKYTAHQSFGEDDDDA